MKELSAEIALQEEALATKKYVLRKFPKAVLSRLQETGEDAYQVDAPPETFTNVRFMYDSNKAEFFVRPFSKLKRSGKPDIIIYSIYQYPCPNRVIADMLNGHPKYKTWEDLPTSIGKAQGNNTTAAPPRGDLERNINMFARSSVGNTPVIMPRK